MFQVLAPVTVYFTVEARRALGDRVVPLAALRRAEAQVGRR